MVVSISPSPRLIPASHKAENGQSGSDCGGLCRGARPGGVRLCPHRGGGHQPAALCARRSLEALPLGLSQQGALQPPAGARVAGATSKCSGCCASCSPTSRPSPIFCLSFPKLAQRFGNGRVRRKGATAAGENVAARCAHRAGQTANCKGRSPRHTPRA